MIREALCRLVDEWRHHLPRSFYLVVVVASAVYILNKFNLPLELPATALLANVAQLYEPGAPARPDVRRHLAVVEIDDKHFKDTDKYKGISPLNRCQLNAQIEQLLKNTNIHVLAIDLDLSPVDPVGYQKAWPALTSTPPGKVDELYRCQHQLETSLQEAWNRKNLSIIVIAPLQPTEGQQPGARWENDKRFANIHFGDNALRTDYGMVHRYEYPSQHYNGPPRRLPFAELVTRELCRKDKAGDGWFARPDPCDQIAAPTSPQQSVDGADPVASSGWGLPWQNDTSYKSDAISYFDSRYLYERGFALSPDDPCLEDPRKSGRQDCNIRIVMLGGSYGVGDQYLTPLGTRSGVQIHAAIAAQLHHHTWHGLGIAADIVIGLVFSFVVHVLWGMYFVQRTAAEPPQAWWRHPQMAYQWLLYLAVGFSGLLLATILGCTWAYARWGIWISPVPMALAMLFESTISGGVHAATHKIKDEAEHSRSTISALESKLSELQSTLSGTPVDEAAAPAAAAVAAVPTPYLAHAPRVLALLMIAYVGYDLISTFHWPPL